MQAALLAALAVWAGGCAQSEKPPPVLLAAVDGLEWQILLPLIQSGELPEVESLVREGVSGYLGTIAPTFSPIIWTSMATGKEPEEHGIRGFVTGQKGGGARRLVNSLDRKSKAFWNILSEYDRRVAVIGWWMTYPVEEINGLMVAQVNTLDQADRSHGKAILKGGLLEGIEGQVFPADRASDLLEIHRQVVSRLPQATRASFGEFAHEHSLLARRLWQNTEWAFRSDSTYVEIAQRVAAEDFDLVAFYLGGADVVGHRFWRHMQPELFQHPPDAAEVEDLGEIIRDYYRFVDRAIGKVRRAMPDDTRVLIVSDHGMRPTRRKASFDPDKPPKRINSGGHSKAPPGVLIAAGSGLPRGLTERIEDLALGDLPELGTIYDVLPTLLLLLEVPVAEDLAGKPLAGLDAAAAAPSVATHDTEEWKASRQTLSADLLEREDEGERLEQLRALGYIQ